MATVWAYSTNVPGKTCKDAKLLGEDGTYLQYPAGNKRGQGGWDVGLIFRNIGTLSGSLLENADEYGPITRLAINVHGSPGAIDADSNNTSYNATKLWNKYSSQLVAINKLLEPKATVIFMGCNVGSMEAGSEFLNSMSDWVFKNKKVVGFTTVGITMQQFRAGEQCSEPGMRDSPYDNTSDGNPAEQLAREKTVLTLPWASETSEHAKVSFNGEIIVNPDPKITAENNFEIFVNTWSVTIGDWKGYFIFTKDKKAYWLSEGSAARHPGKWWTVSGGFYWSFDDDAPGWKRTFEVLTPLKSSMNGNVTIGGRNHGFFSMYRQ